jgi:outer membrane receptor protein involved in Fe transport
MAGVINFITKQGTAEPHGELAIAGGDFARRFIAASHGWQIGPVRYFLSGIHDEFRPFEQFGNISEQFAGPNRTAVQARNQVNLRLDWDIGQRHAFTLFPSYQEQNNPDSQNRNIVFGGEWRWKTTPSSELVTWLNRYNFTRSNDLPGFEESSDYVDWEAESRWSTELGPWLAWSSHRLTVGARVREQDLDQGSVTLQGNEGPITTPAVKASIWQVSPFLQTDILFDEHWSLLVGSSFDVHEEFGLDVNPRATLTWRPIDLLRVSATVGRGFRAPDLVQLFGVDVNFGGLYALLGNPDLQPETDLAFQLETQFRYRGVDAFLVLFRHQFDDLIAFQQLRICNRPGVPPGCVQDPLPQLPGRLRFQTQNISRALTQGLELGIDVQPLELLGYDTPHQPSIGIGYAYLDSRNESGIPGEDGNELPFRPRNRVLPTFGYRHRGTGFTLRVWGEYEADTFTTVANDPIDVARNHWTWNFKVQLAPLRLLPEDFGGRLATAIDVGRHLEFFVEGDNVFDQEFGPVTGAGRLAGPAAYVFGVSGKF